MTSLSNNSILMEHQTRHLNLGHGIDTQRQETAYQVHEAYKRERLADINKLQADALERRMKVQALEQQNYLDAGIRPEQPREMLMELSMQRATEEDQVEVQNEARHEPEEEDPVVLFRLSKARESNKKLYEIVTTLENQLTNARNEHSFIKDAARQLAADFGRLKQRRIDQMNINSSYNNPENNELRAQMNIVKNETRKNNHKNEDLKSELAALKKQKEEIARDLASTEVLLLQSPALFQKRAHEKKIIKEEKQRSKPLSNANVLESLYETIKNLEHELRLMKEANHKFITENRCSQTEIDYAYKTIDALKAAGQLPQATFSEGLLSDRVSRAEAVKIDQEILGTDLRTAELVKDTENEIIKIEIELKSKKLEDLRQSIVPNLEAQIREKRAIISDLERSKFAQSQTIALTECQEEIQENMKSGLMREYDIIEYDNHQKTFEIVA